MLHRASALAFFALCLGRATFAHAQPETAPITDRDWAIDLYDGHAIGSAKVVGMGGTSMAQAEGAEGGHLNPATAGLQRTTQPGWFAWDLTFQALTSRYSTDHDNNGVDGSAGTSILYSALQLQFGRWTVISSGILREVPLAGAATPIKAEATIATFGLVRRWNETGLALGGGFRAAALRVVGSGDREYFSLSDRSFFVGAAWAPPQKTWRLGAAANTPSAPDAEGSTACDPQDCMGLVLPERVRLPWRVSAGGAIRLGPTPWNTALTTPFRDERAVTLAADLVVTGSSADSYGLEAFGQNLWQRSGRHLAVSPRFGAEYEVSPGLLRLRAGSYWEPARFVGVDGRVHFTASFELRVFNFRFLGARRLAFTGAADVARRYNNVGVAFGLWR